MIGSAQKLLMARAGVKPQGPVEFVGFNDTNTQGSYTLDYPTGTQSGDLLFLFCGNDDDVVAGTPSGWTQFSEGATPVQIFHRKAGAESSVVAPSGTNPSLGGAIIVSFRNASYIKSNTVNLATGHTPPTSFTAFSGAGVGNSVVCFVWYDDDIQSGDATQTGFTVALSDFFGAASNSGCSMNVTYALEIIDASSYTPPDLNASGISSEAYFSVAFEIG
jgi:hypothetical protein